MSINKLSWAAIAAGVAIATSSAATADEFQVTDDWAIQITPVRKVGVSRRASAPATTTYTASKPALTDEGAGVASVLPDQADSAPVASMDEYARIYDSIPFSRAEYNANPTFRHDTAMELLTGNPRHQTVVRHTTPLSPPVISHQAGIPINSPLGFQSGVAPTGIGPHQSLGVNSLQRFNHARQGFIFPYIPSLAAPSSTVPGGFTKIGP